MPTSSFAVRKLTLGPVIIKEWAFRYSMSVHEVDSQDLRLSRDEVVSWLAEGALHSTDLVLFEGTWTTIADSMPFCEAAEPYARKEQRLRKLKSAFSFFVFFLFVLALTHH